MYLKNVISRPLLELRKVSGVDFFVQFHENSIIPMFSSQIGQNPAR